jgi:hypothetical protein
MKEYVIQVRKVALLLVLMFFSLSLFAQVTVTGTVTDESGNTLPGVNVFEKNTTNGTITDLDGRYMLKVQNGSTLVFSFVGYDNQEFTVSGTKSIDVVLKENSKEIEEVVVVGYGQQRKASVVGAITQTTGKTLERAAGIADLSSALTGNLRASLLYRVPVCLVRKRRRLQSVAQVPGTALTRSSSSMVSSVR